MDEAFEIHIFPGDPNKGHEGWMASVRIGREYRRSRVAYPTRMAAAIYAAGEANGELSSSWEGVASNG